MTESSLSADELIRIIAVALIVAHVAALIWVVWFRRRITPVLVLNLLVSGGVMAFWAPRLGELFNYVESVWIFVAFELIAFLTSLVAIVTGRVPRAVIWLVFAAHMILIAAALYFMVTFKISRLI